MRRFLAISCCLSILATGTASAFLVSASSEGRWELLRDIPIGKTRTAGHEEITRQAINETVAGLKELGFDLRAHAYVDFLEDLDVKGNHNINGFQTVNPIIKGNFATDFPEELEAYIDVRRRWGHDGHSHWDTDPVAQPLHFLRRAAPDGTLEPQEVACYESRARIKLNTVDAIRLWLKAEAEGRAAKTAADAGKSRQFVDQIRRRETFYRRRSLSLVGHSTHTIQDSFSPLHAIREGKDKNYDIRNVCYYDQEVLKKLAARGEADQGCYHPDPTRGIVEAALAAKGDEIWIRTADQYRLTKREWGKAATQCNLSEFESRGELERYNVENVFESEFLRQHCLKHEARLARVATVRYLTHFALEVERLKGTDPDRMDASRIGRRLDLFFFDGTYPSKKSEIMAEGVMRCDRLKPKAPTPPIALAALDLGFTQRIILAHSIFFGRHPLLMVDRPADKPYPRTLKEYIEEALRGIQRD